MLNVTQNLGTTPVAFIRRGQVGNVATWSPVGGTPSNEQKLRVAHEVTKNGTVNTLYAVSAMVPDDVTLTNKPSLAVVNVKIIRPPAVTAATMKAVIDKALTGLLLSGVQDSLLNQET